MDEALRTAAISGVVALLVALIPHVAQRRRTDAQTVSERAQAGATMMQAAETAVDKLIEPLVTRIGQLETDLGNVEDELAAERRTTAGLRRELATERAARAELGRIVAELRHYVRSQGVDPENLPPAP